MTAEPNSQRAPLSKRRILEAAVSFANEHGVEALTMRKVADALGFGVMSLYNHVANKDEMLVGMVDLVAAEISPPIIDDEWRHAIRASALTAHEVLLAHPWVPSEWTSRMPGPARIDYMNALLQVLTNAGLSSALVYRGYHAVTMHIVGFTLQQIGYETGLSDDLDELASAFLADLADRHVYVAEHVRAHLAGDDHGDEFAFVLDLILDGLEQAHAAT